MVVRVQDLLRLRVADIPGLIDGAHQNRGLGHEFLRHIARTRALMFVVDVAGSEGRDPIEDFASLKEELRLYDKGLVRKPAFVVANKTDLPGKPQFKIASRVTTCVFFPDGGRNRMRVLFSCAPGGMTVRPSRIIAIGLKDS